MRNLIRNILNMNTSEEVTKDSLGGKIGEKLDDKDLKELREIHDRFRTAAIAKAEAEGHLSDLMCQILGKVSGKRSAEAVRVSNGNT